MRLLVAALLLGAAVAVIDTEEIECRIEVIEGTLNDFTHEEYLACLSGEGLSGPVIERRLENWNLATLKTSDPTLFREAITGQLRIRARGQRHGAEGLRVQSFERLNHPLADGVPGNGKGKAHGRNLNTGFVGNVANWAHDTIVVMVDFTNANFGSRTVEQQRAAIYNPDADSLYSRFLDMTGGLGVINDLGVYRVSINYDSSTGCARSTWSNAADSILSAQGVNVGAARYRMYMFPNDPCGGIAWGSLCNGGCGSGRSWYFTTGRDYTLSAPETWLHELGHNQGMTHANHNGQQYADRSCVMGFATGSVMGGWNAAHAWYLGFYAGQTVSFDQASTQGATQLTLTSATRFNPSGSSVYVVELIGNTGETGGNLYVSFIGGETFHRQVPTTWRNKVAITRWTDPSRSNVFTDSAGQLVAGQSITHGDIVVTADSIDTATMTATITITFPVLCATDADCDNGVYCDGAEVCTTSGCVDGPAPCSDNNICDGTNVCNESTDTCDVIPFPGCDDGDACNGLESCDADFGCVAGTPPACGLADGCCADGCSISNDPDCASVCGDGFCSDGETCSGGSDPGACGADCGIIGSSTCGNGVCEAGDGENCVSCPSDCNGQQSGKPARRFCCGDGGGSGPVSCSDSRCSSNGNTCSTTSSPAVCTCGDGVCSSAERCSGTCLLDIFACDPVPATEASCTDGEDDDCDGLVDCADSDCFADAACVQTCFDAGNSCSSNDQCCGSLRCRGRGGNKTCQ